MIFRIGDVVRFNNNNYTCVFIVEDIDSTGWLWGGDVKQPIFKGQKNYHNQKFCENITLKIKIRKNKKNIK